VLFGPGGLSLRASAQDCSTGRRAVHAAAARREIFFATLGGFRPAAPRK